MIYHHHLQNILSTIQTRTCTVWKGNRQEHESQEAGIMDTILENGYHIPKQFTFP